MWSGPRNLSTALLRSFENRNDTIVLDEPFYAYYLKETKKNHPLTDEIINTYETNLDKIINLVIKNRDYIFFQKHMSQHMIKKIPLNWIKSGINCFLIRNPKDVLISYIKKNNLNESKDLGFPSQLKILNFLKKHNEKIIVIDAEDLSNKPEETLKKLCDKINISFSLKMLNWPKGARNSDGLWGKVWYENVKSSSSFQKIIKKESKIPSQYLNIYNECLEIYNKLKIYNIDNEKI